MLKRGTVRERWRASLAGHLGRPSTCSWSPPVPPCRCAPMRSHVHAHLHLFTPSPGQASSSSHP
eukprot:scaffold8164_cov100-Isochrysis_galbana.AAC.1